MFTPRCRQTCEPSPSELDDDIVTYSNHQCSSPCIKTKSVRFSNSQHRNNDDDLGEMIGQLHNLLVRDRNYAILYTQCMSRFPNAMSVTIQPPFFIFHPLPKSFPLHHPHQSFNQHMHSKHQFNASPLPASPCRPHHPL